MMQHSSAQQTDTEILEFQLVGRVLTTLPNAADWEAACIALFPVAVVPAGLLQACAIAVVPAGLLQACAIAVVPAGLLQACAIAVVPAGLLQACATPAWPLLTDSVPAGAA